MRFIPARRLPVRARLGIMFGAAAGVVLLAASCRDTGTEPTPARPMVAPGSQLHAAPSGRTLGPVLMPIPVTNVGRGALGNMRTGLKVPALSAYVVHVSGRITVSSNPEVATCYPYPMTPSPPYGFEGSYGPSGTGWFWELQASAGAVTDGDNWLGFGLWLDQGGKDNASTVQSDTVFAWESQEIWVARSGIQHEVGGGSPIGCGPTGFYRLSSGQTVSVTILDGQELELNPRIAVVKKGAGVTFTTTSRGALVDQPYLLFVPATGTTNATSACDVSGPNPCVMTVRNDGELRASKYLQGRMRSASARVIVYTSFDLTADRITSDIGDTVTFTPLIDGAPGVSARWLWRADDRTEVADPCWAIVEHRCRYGPAASGTMWAYTSSGDGGDSASAHVEVAASHDGEPAALVMIEQATPGMIPPDETFGVPTLRLLVKVVDATGVPVPDASVKLALDGVAGTGGHVHEGARGEARPHGMLDRSTVSTGTTGVATVRYSANNVATDVLVTGTSSHAKASMLTLRIGLDLVDAADAPAWAKTRFEMIGGRPWHPINHFALVNMRASLYALSDAYQEKLVYFKQHPDRLPFGRLPQRLALNDVSLPRGGRFDVNRDWIPAHVSHRKGYDADLDVRRGSQDDALADIIHGIWVRGSQNTLLDERASRNHYHLKLSSTNIVPPTR